MAALKWRERNGFIVVSFTDAKLLDEARNQQIGKELMELTVAAETNKRKLLVNFQGVQFMSSAIIGTLVLLNKKCKQDGVKLQVCSLSPNVVEVFKITRLDRVFDIVPPPDDDLGTDTRGCRVPVPKGPRTDDGRAAPPTDLHG